MYGPSDFREINRIDQGVSELTYSGKKFPDVVIVLASENGQRTLTAEESKRVIEELEIVAREARKWAGMTGRSGRLILIDPELIAEVERQIMGEERR